MITARRAIYPEDCQRHRQTCDQCNGRPTGQRGRLPQGTHLNYQAKWRPLPSRPGNQQEAHVPSPVRERRIMEFLHDAYPRPEGHSSQKQANGN